MEPMGATVRVLPTSIFWMFPLAYRRSAINRLYGLELTPATAPVTTWPGTARQPSPSPGRQRGAPATPPRRQPLGREMLAGALASSTRWQATSPHVSQWPYVPRWQDGNLGGKPPAGRGDPLDRYRRAAGTHSNGYPLDAMRYPLSEVDKRCRGYPWRAPDRCMRHRRTATSLPAPAFSQVTGAWRESTNGRGRDQ